jgi:2'-5' RNA ligase
MVYTNKMNVRFGLYLIPHEGSLYKIGSSLVGYDIRNQRPIAPPDFVDPTWITSDTQFGFHATITDAITIPHKQLTRVIEEIENVLKCFKSDNHYILTKERVGFWRDESTMAILLMKPNRNIEMLHDVLVTKLHPLGTGSEYLDQYLRGKSTFTPNSLVSIQKTEQFFSPFIFDEFAPHFTCINAYTGPLSERSNIESTLAQCFNNISEIEFNTIALVTQVQGESFFRIEKEFNLHGDQVDLVK